VRLKGETALVTGGSRGIGKACAVALAAEGASLALVARGEKELEEAAAQLRGAGARALAIPGDVGDEAFAARAFETAERELGPVSVLVNDAGIVEMATVAQMSLEAWDRVLRVNLTGSFLFAREAVRRMVPRGKGRLVFVSSISATLGTPRLSAYCASKWGVHGLVKSLAEELRCTGVLALGVAPGSTDTEMLRRSGFEPDMQPEDVARVVRFLAAEAPAAMQGSIVQVFG
jgi:NAD(P)-dependent dehydrogenase (short-subunit alcohol dehydrogenase family)